MSGRAEGSGVAVRELRRFCMLRVKGGRLMFGKPCPCSRCRFRRKVAFYFLPLWLLAFAPAVATLALVVGRFLSGIGILYALFIDYAILALFTIYVYLPTMKAKPQSGEGSA
jgi:hypothetical protein